LEVKNVSEKAILTIPDTYDQISETLSTAESILDNAVDNAKTLFHTLILSSLDEGKIVSRVVVLREFNSKERYLRFHTDARAPKIKHFQKNSNASILGYDPALKIQLKLQGNVEVHLKDDVTIASWNESTTRSKKCYSVEGGSSLEIDNPAEYDIRDVNIEDGYLNFAVIKFTYTSLEFLYLKSSGHRRAVHSWDEELTSNWLVP
jgi:3-hydroxyisobutyrate dehydrogenase